MFRKAAMGAFSLALLTALGACVTATPYQPRAVGHTGGRGYSETKLEANRYRVSFAGNSLTSRETVEGYLLYHAAELTLAQGFDSFVIVDRHTDRDARQLVTPDPYYHGPAFGYWRPSWRYRMAGFGWRAWDPFWNDPFFYDEQEVRTIEQFEAAAEIIMLKGPKDAADPKAFDAHAVVENLGPKIQRPEPKA